MRCTRPPRVTHDGEGRRHGSHTFHMPPTLRPGRAVQHSTRFLHRSLLPTTTSISSSREGARDPCSGDGAWAPGCSLFPMSMLRPDPHLPGKVTPALSAYRSTLHTQYATCRERFARRDPAPCMRVVRGEKVRRACSSSHHERLASDLQRSLRDVLCPCNNNNCTNT